MLALPPAPAIPAAPALAAPTGPLDAALRRLNDNGSGGGGNAAPPAPNPATPPTAVAPLTLALSRGDDDDDTAAAAALVGRQRWRYAAAGFRDAERLRQTHGRTRDAAFRSHNKLLPTALLGRRLNPETTIRGHRKEIFCAIFDKSGCRAITGSDDHLVKIWSTETAVLVHACRGHTGEISYLAVNASNEIVASGQGGLLH